MSVWRWSRRIGIAVVGGAVLALGIAMIVLPGPAFVVIPAGLGILGLEFERPRRWLERVKAHVHAAGEKLREKHKARKS